MSVSLCKIIDLPKVIDNRGNLTAIESKKQIPFEFKRIFYLYDVPAGESRGGHALMTCDQFIIAANGSFDVILDDGSKKVKFHLNRPYQGLYVCNMVWRELDNFSSGSVCLVLASDVYNEKDYIRDYAMFKKLKEQETRIKHV